MHGGFPADRCSFPSVIFSFLKWVAKADVTIPVHTKSPLSHIILKEIQYYTDGLIQSADFLNMFTTYVSLNAYGDDILA